VIVHKSIYTVIQFPSQDAALLANCIELYLIPSMQYKLPVAFFKKYIHLLVVWKVVPEKNEMNDIV
jgi:hypothetical protein